MVTRQTSLRADPHGADVARGMAAAAAILVLVGGVPWALSTFVGWPLPSSIPSWSEITTALGDTYIPDTFLAKALAVVCWLVWIELVASLLVEVVAVLRGRQAANVPLTGPVQRLVARLVAAVSLMVILVVTRPDRPVQAVPVPLPVASADLVSSPAGPTEARGEPSGATYVVQRRDTLWGIAETCLGDPFRWVEIWERNQGRPQPDGAAMVDPDRIHPGWVLDLPRDATHPSRGADPGPEASPAGTTGESMTPLEAGSLSPGGSRLVSRPGSAQPMEVMVPLAPQGDAGAHPSELAAEDPVDPAGPAAR